MALRKQEPEKTFFTFSDFEPMNTESIDQTLRGYCVFCGEQDTKTIMHHFPLPRWLEGNEVVPLCPSCHTKFEAYFTNFIKYGQFKPKIWIDQQNQKRLSKNWDLKNKDRLRPIKAESAKKRYWENPEKHREEARKRFLKDPEKSRERQRRWYHNNPEKVKERRKANRAYYREWQRQDRIKRKNKLESEKK